MSRLLAHTDQSQLFEVVNLFIYCMEVSILFHLNNYLNIMAAGNKVLYSIVDM